MNTRRGRWFVIIRAEGACLGPKSVLHGLSWFAMKISRPRDRPDPSECLRIRSCCDPNCRVVFTICASCDRGQRYCSAACRQRMRREHVRAAGRRYQASPHGRLRHRLRQRAYRRRASQGSVTHPPVASIANSVVHPPRSLQECMQCLRQSAWIELFPDFRPSRRRRSRPRAPTPTS